MNTQVRGALTDMKRVCYAGLEAATAHRGVRRTIDGETYRLPLRLARYYGRNYDPAKRLFLARNACRGTDVLDLGAHIGIYTVTMARNVGPAGRVHAFEPAPDTRAALREVLALNQCERSVEVRGDAVSELAGDADLYLTGASVSNANSLVGAAGAGAAIRVNTVSVDEYVAQHGLDVGLMKIDIEGAELMVLRGARATLRRCRPALTVEVHPRQLLDAGGSSHELFVLLEEFGYAVRRGSVALDAHWLRAQEASFELEALPGLSRA
jgi:FkbM family methyltransferase